MRFSELPQHVVQLGQRLGASDAACLGTHETRKIVRFANNEVTVTETLDSNALAILISRERRVLISGTEDIERARVDQSLKRMIETSETVAPSESYTPLPHGPFEYREIRGAYDHGVASMNSELVEYAKSAIDHALRSGAKRVAGILTCLTRGLRLVTSGDIDASWRSTTIQISVRAFVSEEATGHDVSISRSAAGFKPELAGERAAEMARLAVDPVEIETGKYDVVLGPSMFANLANEAVGSASAFSVDAGLSFFRGMLGHRVAPPWFSLIDDGVIPEGVASRPFDDEGAPTGETIVINNGVLRSYLHNSSTARKFGAKTTGNAGWIAPMPWNAVVSPGRLSEEELLEAMGDGLYLANNWYTRFQDRAKGDFSTICRDGAFIVKGGKIDKPVKGLRVSDNMLRILGAIQEASRERKWIRWWEVSIPTLAPSVWVKDVGITRSTR